MTMDDHCGMRKLDHRSGRSPPARPGHLRADPPRRVSAGQLRRLVRDGVLVPVRRRVYRLSRCADHLAAGRARRSAGRRRRSGGVPRHGSSAVGPEAIRDAARPSTSRRHARFASKASAVTSARSSQRAARPQRHPGHQCRAHHLRPGRMLDVAVLGQCVDDALRRDLLQLDRLRQLVDDSAGPGRRLGSSPSHGPRRPHRRLRRRRQRLGTRDGPPLGQAGPAAGRPAVPGDRQRPPVRPRPGPPGAEDRRRVERLHESRHPVGLRLRQRSTGRSHRRGLAHGRLHVTLRPGAGAWQRSSARSEPGRTVTHRFVAHRSTYSAWYCGK